MPWIKVETTTPEKPEMGLLAARLGVSQAEAFLSWFRLYSWLDAQSRDGHVRFLSGSQADTLSASLPGTAEALASPEIGWLMIDSGGLKVMNWDRHCGSSSKARALDSERKHRARRQSGTTQDGCPVVERTNVRVRTGHKREEEEKTRTETPEAPGATPPDSLPSTIVELHFPTKYPEWVRFIEAGGKGGPVARLVEMLDVLFESRTPGTPAPGVFGRMGALQKRYGAIQVAEVLWKAAARPPAGDILNFVEGVLRGQGKQRTPHDDRVPDTRTQGAGDPPSSPVERVAGFPLPRVPGNKVMARTTAEAIRLSRNPLGIRDWEEWCNAAGVRGPDRDRIWEEAGRKVLREESTSERGKEQS